MSFGLFSCKEKQSISVYPEPNTPLIDYRAFDRERELIRQIEEEQTTFINFDSLELDINMRVIEEDLKEKIKWLKTQLKIEQEGNYNNLQTLEEEYEVLRQMFYERRTSRQN